MLTTVAWDGGPTGNGTNFLDPVNWVGDVLPASNQTASIGATGTSPTISIAGTTNISVIQSSRVLQLDGGTISGVTLTATGSGKLNFSASGGTLDGLTANAPLDLTGNSVFANVTNGLTLNGIATIGGTGSYNRLEFAGTQTLGGTGQVVFADGSYSPAIRVTNNAAVLTIGSSMTVHGGASFSGSSALIGYVADFGGAANISVINQGTISADVSGKTIKVMGGSFSSSNIAKALNGGVLDIAADSWNSTGGTITVNNSTLNLGGGVTTAGLNLPGFSRTGGTVNITGTLDNTAASLPLTAATGSWSLLGGTLKGGTLSASGGFKLILTTSGGTLSGLTSNADLDLTGNSVFANVINGLTLNGIATIGGTGSYNRLEFSGTQTLGGTGQVVFSDGSYSPSLRVINNAAVLTIGSRMTVHGGASVSGSSALVGYVADFGGAANVSIINQGTISADVSGKTIKITGGSFSSSGSVKALNGGILDIAADTWNSTGGTTTVNNSTLNLGGGVTTAALNLAGLTRTGGTINITGTLDNTAAILPLTAATGSLNLLGGTLKGGTLTASGGSKLTFTTSGGTLSGLTSNADLDLTGNSVFANVINGLTLNGIATIGGTGSYNRLEFAGTQTLGGTGQVVFADGSYSPSLRVLNSAAVLTIGSGMTIHGGASVSGSSALIGYVADFGGAPNISVINQGTISADVSNKTIRITGAGLSNSGAVKALNGGILDIAADSWNSAGGTTTVNNSTLNLGGSVTTAGLNLPGLSRTGGTINITGTLDNTAAVLPLTAATGSLTLLGGTLKGGTLNASGGAKLVFTTGGGILNGLTSNSNLDLTGASALATVTNGLTLNGVATIGGAGSYNRLEFAGTQTLGGTGQILFADGSYSPCIRVTTDAAVLTIGSSMTVHGGASFSGATALIGYVADFGGFANVSVINQGTVSADVSTLGIRTESAGFTNTGTLSAKNGGELVIKSSLTNYASGTLAGGTYRAEANSVLRLPGVDVTTNAASIILDGANSFIYDSDVNSTSAVAPLASNTAAGSLTLLNSRDLTTAGAFSNAGAVVLSPGSILTVAGNYGQTSTGSFTTQITGPVAGIGFGQITASGADTLAGTLNVSLLNSYLPSSPDGYRVLTFASRTGDFATKNGLTFTGGKLNPLYDATGLTLDANFTPDAVNDSVTLLEDHAATFNVLGNDTDPDHTDSNPDLDPPTLFSITQPAAGTGSVANNGSGSLTYTPPADFNGAASFTYTIKDVAGNTDTATVNLTVTPVNDAPSFTLAGNQAVNEDAGPRNLANMAFIHGRGPVTATDEDNQSLTFTTTVTGTTGNLAFTSTPILDAASGVLSFTTAPNTNGTFTIQVVLKDGGGTANGGVDTTAPQTMIVTVNAVNDAPIFSLSGTNPPTVNEDAAAQTVLNMASGMVPGPATATDETGQTVSFVTAVSSTTGNVSFSSGPTINAATGTLTYTLAPDTAGTATISVKLSDNGGTANGGVNLSAAQFFTITVNPINDAPGFSLAGNPAAVNEDTGAHSVGNFVGSIRRGNPGATDEETQTLTLTASVTSTTGNLTFTSGPSLDAASGILTYTAAPDSNGTATVTVGLTDNGGTANGGSNTAPTQTFTITVNPINDAPTLALIPSQTTTFGGSKTVTLTGLSAGPANESGQTLTLSAASDNTAVVAATPTIVNNGDGTATLTYTPTGAGSAQITVLVTDNGGTASGGVNSATRSFTVQVNSTLAGRKLFYNNSYLDGNAPAAGASDDGAIAANKSALLPGGTVGAANISGFAKGINGIMIDIAGLTAGTGLSASDFAFRTSTGGSWTAGPTPASVTVRRGVSSGVDRITFIWAETGVDKAVMNGWLEVTVKATANTGLSTADVFAFGNLVGDVNGDRAVTVGDLGVLATNFNKPSGATIEQGDFNLDGAVTVGDLGILATAFNRTLAAPPAVGQLTGGSSGKTSTSATAVLTEASDPAASATATPPVLTTVKKSRAFV